MPADFQNILQEVSELLRHFLENPPPIKPQTELVNDLGLDSLQVMELVEEFEDAFDISFPINELSEIRTVEELARAIQQQVTDS